MTVTISYTSKGLFDAFQKEVIRQKQEGKISGDVSYGKIFNCNFLKKLQEVNEKHASNNKVYRGADYSCADRGKKVDWSKTLVVHGSTVIEEGDWEELVRAMGLTIVSEHKPKVQEQPEEKNKVATETEVKAAAATLVSFEMLGNSRIESAEMFNRALDLGYTFEEQDAKIVIKDSQGNPISDTQLLNILQVDKAKQDSLTTVRDTVPEN